MSEVRRRHRLLRRAALVVAAALILPGLPLASAAGTAVVQGRIVGAGGVAIPGAEAHLCAVNQRGDIGAEVAVGTADRQGNYRITALRKGRYTVLFKDPYSDEPSGTRFYSPMWLGPTAAKGYECGQNNQLRGIRRFTLKAGQVTKRTGVLPLGGRLIGVTRDTRGEAVARIQVSYRDSLGFDTASFSGREDTVPPWSSGRYRTRLMSGGIQRVTFYDLRFGTSTTTSVTIRPGRATTLDPEFARAELTAVQGSPFVTEPAYLIHDTLLTVVDVWSHAQLTRRYQWLRDGQPIAGATQPQYALTAADVGHRISARVVASKPGYTTLTLTTPPIDGVLRPVDAAVVLDLDASVARRRNPTAIHAQVHVELSNEARPAGVVTVWDDTQGEESGGHVKVAAGRPDDEGNVVLAFPKTWGYSTGQVYAEFVADDETLVNTAASDRATYRLR